MFTITLPWRFAPIKFPITEWLPEYQWKEWIVNDLAAGFTVFVFLIPQGMAYALLAGMPPIYGLYSSIVPLYIYAILGTSKHLSLGPMAITSLLLNVSVKSYGFEEQSPEYIKTILNLSLVVGLCVLIIGLLKLGSLVNLISASVLTGFLTASAVVIFLEQIKFIFGLTVPRFDYTYQTIAHLVSHLGESNANASALGLATFAVLILVREWKKRNKPTEVNLKSTQYKVLDMLAKLSNLLCIIFGSIIAYVITEGGTFIDIVGDVPSGLKAPGFEGISFTEGLEMIPSALIVSFVAFAGNWAVAKKYAAEFNYDVDATQELIAEGLAVTVGAVFNSFAGSGALARTAVVAESGALTQLAAVVVATLVLISVEFLTALFFYIPMSVLGAIIMVSVISMMDFDAMMKAYHTHPNDCAVMVLTCLSTFFIGVSEGLFIGIGLSLAIIIYNTAFPSISHLGRLCDQDGGHYKSIDRFENAKQHPGVAIVRMNATLFFANSAYFKEVAMRAVNGEFHSSKEEVTHLIVDASCWIDIDLPATQTIIDLWKELDKKNISLSIVGAKAVIRDRLRECDFPEERVRRYHYFTIQAAMEDIDHSVLLGEILPERKSKKIFNNSPVKLVSFCQSWSCKSHSMLPTSEDNEKQQPSTPVVIEQDDMNIKTMDDQMTTSHSGTNNEPPTVLTHRINNHQSEQLQEYHHQGQQEKEGKEMNDMKSEMDDHHLHL